MPLNVHTQLYLGNLANKIGYSFAVFLIIMCIPVVVWLVVSLIRWRVLGKAVLLKWWAITAGIICACGVSILVFARLFGGAAYNIAFRTNIHIPMSVHVLENDHLFAMDEVEDYVVVQFNQVQMDAFIKSAKAKGWKSGTVAPYSLIDPAPGHEDPMSGRKNPLPKVQRDGYYYSLMDKRYKGQAWYTERMACFLDAKSRTLYVYYDDSQWG